MLIKRLNRKKINPSTPIFTGSKYVENVEVELYKYDKGKLIEASKLSKDIFDLNKGNRFRYWLNVYGIHDVDQITKIADIINIHDLVLQDILDVNQRPKCQDYGDYIFFSLKSILPTVESEVEYEQISFVVGKNYLITFNEKHRDHFKHVGLRIKNNVGIVRERDVDYLLFLVLESILDNYFKTVSSIEYLFEKMEVIDVQSDPSPTVLKTIEQYKRQIQQLKKTVFPIRDFSIRVEREQFDLIESENKKYFLELKDLCLSLIDDCERLEDGMKSYMNLFFSVQGHRMNNVMKTLTIVSTIFIPLTFISGIYGMNFEYMPELKWEMGYFSIWIIMGLVSISMLFYFKKKKWF